MVTPKRMRITPSAEWPHEATRVTLIGAPIYTMFSWDLLWILCLLLCL